jgi:hypothetical protein
MILSPETLLGKIRVDFESLVGRVQQSAAEHQRIDRMERDLLAELLAMGFQLLQLFIATQGTGDVGPTVETADQSWKRLENLHSLRYVSIFGELEITRTVYGTRETQKIEAVPLDAQLGLPAGDFSYVLEDWLQRMCIHDAYRESVRGLADLLGLSVSVRSAEAMNQTLAEHAEAFRSHQAPPDPSAEGQLLVVTADGKGVVMRREDQPEQAASPPPGKKGTKRMAYVGAVYSIDRFVRTADDVLDELQRKRRAVDRPVPQQKHVWAEMTHILEGEACDGRVTLFGQMSEELAARNPSQRKPVVCVMDGERALWEVKESWVPDAVGVLDLFHATERLWAAAHVFHPRESREARWFVDQRLRMLLEGQVGYVIGGLRQMLTKRRLSAADRKTLSAAVGYYENNRQHMKYDEYLAAGYPIGSGVAEGTCRHLVKDRMERTGMRWRRTSAQAMLHLRAIYLNGDWDAFIECRIQREQEELYCQAA